jgi:glucose uptake protein
MFAPQSFAPALVMVVISAICWGSWANTFKGTRHYRFELFYWDYILGVVGIALVLALTLGSMYPDHSAFLANVRSADLSNIVCALAGGAIFNVANLLLVAGIEMAGLAIAFPVAIGIALAVGVVMSYIEQPKGNAVLLLLAVVCAIAAVVFDGRAYRDLSSSRTALSRKSIVVCVISGLLMGLFAPLVARAMNTGHALNAYSVGVFFSLGALLCCGVVNIYFMRHPLVGAPVSAKQFFTASARNHTLGIVGGIIWGVGMVFNFVAASLTGVAISYAIGQSAPMVAALWGIVAWKEFDGSSSRARVYLALMFLFFILAIVLASQAYRATV